MLKVPYGQSSFKLGKNILACKSLSYHGQSSKKYSHHGRNGFCWVVSHAVFGQKRLYKCRLSQTRNKSYGFGGRSRGQSDLG